MGDISIETKNISSNDVLSSNSTEVSDLQQLKVGAGSSIFYTDKEGSRWGHINFDSAKAWIKVDGSAKFKSSAGDTLLDTGATDGNFINIINNALNTSSKTILTDFTFESTDYAGAFKTGNITWSDTTGLVTGGTGIVMNARGIIGANAGVATFSIDSTTGNATFAGTLSGASGTFGTITSGTIQGCTIQSTSGANKIELSTGDSLNFYYSSAIRGYIKAESTTDLTISANDDVRFRAGGSVRCQAGSDSFRPTGTDKVYDLGTDANQWRGVYAERYYAGASGTGGFVGPNTYGFITALRISGSAGRVDMDGKYREITFIGGIVTNVAAETDWVFLDSASGI